MENFFKENVMKISDIKQKVVNTATIGAVAMLPAVAMANDIPAPDTSKIVTYIGTTAVAAVVAIGGAKMIPAAAMWLYTSITNMIKRS